MCGTIPVTKEFIELDHTLDDRDEAFLRLLSVLCLSRVISRIDTPAFVKSTRALRRMTEGREMLPFYLLCITRVQLIRVEFLFRDLLNAERDGNNDVPDDAKVFIVSLIVLVYLEVKATIMLFHESNPLSSFDPVDSRKLCRYKRYNPV